jgi:hypothetical protein
MLNGFHGSCRVTREIVVSCLEPRPVNVNGSCSCLGLTGRKRVVSGDPFCQPYLREREAVVNTLKEIMNEQKKKMKIIFRLQTIITFSISLKLLIFTMYYAQLQMSCNVPISLGFSIEKYYILHKFLFSSTKFDERGFPTKKKKQKTIFIHQMLWETMPHKILWIKDGYLGNI